MVIRAEQKGDGAFRANRPTIARRAKANLGPIAKARRIAAACNPSALFPSFDYG
jgi:hypothetical protein